MTPNFSVLILTRNLCVQISGTSGGTISTSHLFLSKSSPNSQVTMAPKNAINKLFTKPTRVNLVVNLGASTKIDVSTYSYDTRSKTKALPKAQAQTLSMFNNILYDTSPNSKVTAPQTICHMDQAQVAN